jgi:hypothetical protein
MIYSGVVMHTKSVHRIETVCMASLSEATSTKSCRGKDAMKLGGGVRDNTVKFGSSLKALINVEPKRLSISLRQIPMTTYLSTR